MGEALRTISFKVRTASCGGTACINSFGDEQLAVDMLADKLLFEVSLRLISNDNIRVLIQVLVSKENILTTIVYMNPFLQICS